MPYNNGKKNGAQFRSEGSKSMIKLHNLQVKCAVSAEIGGKIVNKLQNMQESTCKKFIFGV